MRAESPSIFLENIGKIEGDSTSRVYYIMNLFVNFKLINFWEIYVIIEILIYYIYWPNSPKINSPEILLRLV